MKTQLIYVIALLAALSACTPQAQVVTLRGSNVQPAADGFVLDTDTLTLRYSFSSERGQMVVSLVNKLDRPLYVDWKRSSFIIGEDKMDYWTDVADVNLATSSYTSRYWRYTVGSVAGTISKDDAVSFIPPRTRLEKRRFVVVPNGALRLTGTPTVRNERANWNPERKKPIDVAVYTYEPSESPLRFRNYLTLSTDKDFRTEFHLDTSFWAAGVEVMPKLQVLGPMVQQFNGTYSAQLPFKKNDGFYIPMPTQQ
ncbi:hypothetical protein GGR92_004542 [Spirosoma lacussanchae]|uniref:hypothetical protein n=1 Tax=Spirosoma lacussanchae TaxID=1884249 RepID=UPI0011083AE6|nr:hypothetical protein [Spirosoma lacussanchae]